MSSSAKFGPLPTGMRIPASPSRVVSLQRSRNLTLINVGGREHSALAYLATLYLLRGTYALYGWLQWEDQSGGMLAGGQEVAVTEHGSAELEALDWLGGHGFQMEAVALEGLDHTSRLAVLAPLPFAHRADVDPSEIPGGSEPIEDHLSAVLGEATPRDAVRQLRSLLVSS